MKRLVSIFLSLMILLCCVVPVSATGFDPDTNGYSYDGLPYLSDSFVYTGHLQVGESVSISFNPPMDSVNTYIEGVFITNDPDPVFSSELVSFTLTDLGNNLFYFSVRNSNLVKKDYPITYIKGGGNYFQFLTFNVSPVTYIRHDITMRVNQTFNYSIKNYINSSGEYTTSSATSNDSNDYLQNEGVFTPKINPNTGPVSSSALVNEQSVLNTVLMWFDWTRFDRVDLYFRTEFTDLIDYTFYVDGINVVDSIQSYSLNNNETTIVTLDFSDLDKNINSNNCYLRFRGYSKVSSASQYRVIQFYGFTGFIRTVSNNFWPSWLMKIINKLDNIFTGRGQDQTAADSFNESVTDQSNELEDLTADLNSVTRPPLSDVNLSTSTMVDSGTIVLATSGIASILSNTIILRVLLMALTFALAGFILFGKR